MPPVIDHELCTKCGMCAEVCPVDVYYGSEKDSYPSVSYGDDCFYCGSCMLECSHDAISFRYPLFTQPSYIA